MAFVSGPSVSPIKNNFENKYILKLLKMCFFETYQVTFCIWCDTLKIRHIVIVDIFLDQVYIREKHGVSAFRHLMHAFCEFGCTYPIIV